MGIGEYMVEVDQSVDGPKKKTVLGERSLPGLAMEHARLFGQTLEREVDGNDFDDFQACVD